LEDARHVSTLQGEAKLDAQEAEAHVPNLPEREFFGAHVESFLIL
jgi:hypothetical protein